MQVLSFVTGALGTGTYLVHDGTDALIIDPGAECPALQAAVKENELAVRAILLTHTHFDHMLGVPSLQRAYPAALIVPAEDERGLTDPRYSLVGWMSDDSLPPLTADRTVTEGSRIEIGGLTLSTLHTPGHTRGSSCYQIGDVLFSGDTLFDGGYGRTDLPGGSMSDLTRSLARLETLPRPLTVYPGHGGAFLWR
ncbi:MAG: MBL fold metallo-hydrolase [Clostridia bacterium]|nr:MBL fold metallo-hydrolase [Clostridia bacterium]